MTDSANDNFLPSVSVIVPTYREARNLPELIQRIDRVRVENGFALELIIVDDNSADGSEEFIASLQYPWIRLIVRRAERGLSSAVIRGLESADNDVLVVMDADLSHPPEAIPALVERLRAGADFAIGSRYVRGGSTDVSWGLFRWLNSKAATIMARSFTRARDPMSGFFALRRAMFRQADQLNPIGYKIGLELLVKCRCQRIEEVPIHFSNRTRGESKLNLREQFRYLQHLARLVDYRYHALLRTLALLLVLSAFLVPAVSFLHRQSIYVDETTQLSGLSLGPVELTTWLVGDDITRFDIPLDRAPPLSYWLGWLWSRAFGLSEGAMRWFGVLCTGVAIILIFEAARRAWGLAAATTAGLVASLSPNVIVNAVEIRSYPLFLLFSAGGFFFLMGLIASPAQRQGRWLLGMAACAVLAMYTHFFGLLLAGSLFTAAFLVRWLSRRPIAATAAAGAITLLAGMGLWPFVHAAFRKSGGNWTPPAPDLSDLATFIYRGLFGHPAMSVSVPIAMGAMLAFLALIVIALWPKRSASAASYAALIALAVGMAVAIALRFGYAAFDSLHPAYNLWRVPGFALALGSALAVRTKGPRMLARLAAAALIGCSAFGAAQLMVHGQYFAHGPHRQIAEIVARLGSDQVAVVHDGESPFGHVYYPLRFYYGSSLHQYTFSPGNPGAVEVVEVPRGTSKIDPLSLPARFLVVVQDEQQRWSDLAEQIKKGDRRFPAGPVSQALDRSQRWRLVEEHTFVSLLAAQVRIYERQ